MIFDNNPWFVGIATGLISSILVFFITNWIMKKKGKDEYYRRVDAANESVILSVKPYIAEQGLPAKDIFDSVVLSVARKYEVQRKDMYSVAIYCEELIQEIFSDIYVAADKKKEYSEALIKYKKETQVDEQKEEIKQIKYPYAFGKRDRTILASYIAVISMVYVIICVLSINLIGGDNSIFIGEFSSINVVMVLPVVVTLVSTSVLLLLERITKNKMRRDAIKNIDNEHKKGVYRRALAYWKWLNYLNVKKDKTDIFVGDE